MHGPGEGSGQSKVLRVGKHGNLEPQLLYPVARAGALKMNATEEARADTAVPAPARELGYGCFSHLLLSLKRHSPWQWLS